MLVLVLRLMCYHSASNGAPHVRLPGSVIGGCVFGGPCRVIGWLDGKSDAAIVITVQFYTGMDG